MILTYFYSKFNKEDFNKFWEFSRVLSYNICSYIIKKNHEKIHIWEGLSFILIGLINTKK